MEEKEKTFKVTPGRIVLLRSLDGGIVKKWSELRLAYFGPDRSKSKASTAFHMSLTKLISLGTIAKEGDGYKITDAGQGILNQAKETVDVNAQVSAAQAHFIAPAVEETPAQ